MAADNNVTSHLATPKLTGKVKWLDSQGIGYILPDNPFFAEVFISPLSLSSSKPIKEGDRVKFNTIFNGSHSLEAINVVPIGAKCGSCKRFGHISRNCQESKISKIKCFRCGLFGHYSMNCDQNLQGWFSDRSSGPHNENFSDGDRGGGVYNGEVGPTMDSMVVNVNKREDLKKVEEVEEDWCILEFDPTLNDDGVKVNSMVCVKKGEDLKKVEEVEDCFILEYDPAELDDFSNLSICENSSSVVGDADDVSIVAEKGKVACRDYPHPRHLCAIHPFKKDSHELHCKMCYCYICDIPAPCKKWSSFVKCPNLNHCDATDESVYWRIRRDVVNKVYSVRVWDI